MIRTIPLEIAIGAFFLAVGLAGPPLQIASILWAALVCAAIVALGRFAGAVAMIAVIAGGYLQHKELRISLLVAGAVYGIAAHLLLKKPRATALMAIAAITGLAFLFFG